MSSLTLRVPAARQAQIAALAERVALEGFAGERVDPEQVARDARVRFDYADFPEDFDGILMFDAGSFYLVCNERRALRGAARSRFTFAPELGHYFIGTTGPRGLRASQQILNHVGERLNAV